MTLHPPGIGPSGSSAQPRVQAKRVRTANRRRGVSRVPRPHRCASQKSVNIRRDADDPHHKSGV